MYHDVASSEAVSSGGTGAYFSVSSESFRRQLTIIRELGLTGRSLAETIRDPAGTVAITFDDGNAGQARQAFPALRAMDMTATFFITTGWVGTPGYVTWDQLREMRAGGMAIESHTHSHPFLSEMDASRLRDELTRSRDLLDEHLGQRTTMLALPGGDAPRPDLRHVLATSGYEVVATSRWGRNGRDQTVRPRSVKRCTVRRATADDEFAAIVTGNRWMELKKNIREGTLAFIRSSLGPTRYARWRRRVLDSTE